MKTLKEWAEAHGVTFVGRSAGVYTTGTVSAAALEEIFAEADALRRERDELAADYSRLLEKHSALHITAKRSRDERVALTADLSEVSASHAELAARLAEIRSVLAGCRYVEGYPAGRDLCARIATALDLSSSSAAAPERAAPDHLEDVRGMVCATSGLLGATSGVGRECDYWAGGVCTSPEPCQHQQPVKPCRTCGPDACSDSTSCPRGGAA